MELDLSRRSAAHKVKNDRNHRKNQEDVNKERGDMEYQKASKPQQKQDNSKTKPHNSPLSNYIRCATGMRPGTHLLENPSATELLGA
jgi:hypothetical protein